MKNFQKISLIVFFNCLFLISVCAQIYPPAAPVNPGNPTAETNNFKEIAVSLAKISKSVDSLNSKMKVFAETFSSNQGLLIGEKEQKILFAFELLNRAEQRLLTLQNLKMSVTDKQVALKLQLARNTDSLLPESVDKYVATRGTLNAEQIRDIRRQALNREKNEITNFIADNESTLRQTLEEIRQTEQFLQSVRQKNFPGSTQNAGRIVNGFKIQDSRFKIQKQKSEILILES